MLDVGHGDAIVIKLPNNKTMLIDTAKKDKAKKRVIAYLLNKNISKIDYLVLSHNHKDHIGGAPAIIKKFKVKEVWGNGSELDTPYVAALKEAIRKKGTKVVKFNRSKQFTIGGVKVDVLNLGKVFKEENDNSLVIKFTYNRFSMLFAGDLEFTGQRRAYKKFKSELKSDVLKLPHHGVGRYDTKFLKATSAKFALISASKKDIDGAKDIIEKLEDLNITVKNTDVDGNISVETDGDDFLVN